LALEYPNAKTSYLILDNLNIHRRKALRDVFGGEMTTEVWDRFTVHYTPTHRSWLNQAEFEIGMFARQCLAAEEFAKSTTEALRGHISGAWPNAAGHADRHCGFRRCEWTVPTRTE
jgi:hypothetical protein